MIQIAERGRRPALPPQQRNVGFVFQHYAAFKHMTVATNVAFGLEIRKRPKAEIERRGSRSCSSLVQLEQFADRYPAQLSGGQRQRMALARALAVEPQVLLLDEPFGALDAQVRKELRDWLRRLHDEVHVTTVFVTHDQEEAMEVADRIVVMDDGPRRSRWAPRASSTSSPANDFVMSFLGPVTRLGEALGAPARHRDRRATHGDARRGGRRAGRPARVRGARRAVGPTAAGWAQLTRDGADDLGLERGREVHLRPTRERIFGAEQEPVTAGVGA